MHLYDPLPGENAIRLIHIERKIDNESLTCSLVVIPEPFSTPRPKYHALSYRWGVAEDMVDAVCNGVPIRITKSLSEALQQLSCIEGIELIWADAICIDQSNSKERSQQVAIMKRIYEHASCVVVWLGLGAPTTAPAFELIRKIGRACCIELYGYERNAGYWKDRLDYGERHKVLGSLRKLSIFDATQVDWRSFWMFFQAQWFFRVWVIQEVQSNKDVRMFCGDAEIEWHFVALAASWARYASWRHPEFNFKKKFFPSLQGFENACFMWEETSYTRRNARSLSVLRLTRMFEASDPRDKVFANLTVLMRKGGRMLYGKDPVSCLFCGNIN